MQEVRKRSGDFSNLGEWLIHSWTYGKLYIKLCMKVIEASNLMVKLK